MAQSLNCRGADAPCGECESCRKIAAGLHADVQVIHVLAAGESADGKARTEISIEQVRQIQHWANLPPYEGLYRVFIFDGAEQMSLEAANCLLKVLEEPPERVVFILLSAEPERLPETVVSRCQCLELRPVSPALIEEALLEAGLTCERARLLSRLCHGAPGTAFAAASDEGWMDERQSGMQQMLDIIGSDYAARFDYAARLPGLSGQRRAELENVLERWLDLWRDLLLVKAGAPGVITNTDYLDKMEELVGGLELEEIKRFLSLLRKSRRNLRRNVNAQLVMEVLMLEMPRSLRLAGSGIGKEK
jgi:DNA polymerase-3 subunit delta'